MAKVGGSLTVEQNKNIQTEQSRYNEVYPMFRLAMDSLALASVASFVWMVCQVAQFAG
jgi:hypothetical protein